MSRALDLAALVPIASVSIARLIARLFAPSLPGALGAMARVLEPLHLANAYGLFSVMTTVRLEIEIEASMNGRDWRAYAFKYKPGDPAKRPRWVGLHMPRLDWQMWFAAMRPPPPWFLQLLVRLLEASPDVLALFERAPFGDTPPRYVRATLYAYTMTDARARARTGAWWTREEIGPYVPPVSISPAAGAEAYGRL